MNYSFILVTGGARSGKSRFAEELSLSLNREYWSDRKISYIATGEVMDQEFRDRIEKHKLRRGDEFVTVEEPLDICGVIKRSAEKSSVIMIECLATWMGNVFHYKSDSIAGEVETLLESLKGLTKFKRADNRGKQFIEKENSLPDSINYRDRRGEVVVVFVTNEVGSGIVPVHKEVRFYRDMLGILNAGLGTVSEHVFSCTAGIATKIG